MREALFKNREISWLSFNYRVLQEAKDPRVPLYERLKFLAIYSSNQDEFFNVRVAGLRSLLKLSKKTQKVLDFDPEAVLKKLLKMVNKYQIEYGQIFRTQIIPGLRANDICLIGEKDLSDNQKKYIYQYFHENIVHQIQPVLLVKNRILPFLRNRRLYLAVKLKPKNLVATETKKKRIQYRYAIVEIPSNHLPRFIKIPSDEGKTTIMFLDDIIRYHLGEIFMGYDTVSSYALKLTRDAELYIEDEFSGNLIEKLSRSLLKRNVGAPSRFLYDESMPKDFIKFLKEALQLEKEDLIPGGKYHNFSDFFNFPNPGRIDLENKKLPPLRSTELDNYPNLFDAIAERDFLLHFPYHTYDYVVDFLYKSATDPGVTSIYITQYRVAKHSEIVNSLIKAVKNKKKVMVFVEVKARFDEESNIHWAEEMQQAGIKVHYSFPGLKVHSKIALIKRIENGVEKKYCYLATGNFNEKTAQLYSDTGMFTADDRITEEVGHVFEYLAGNTIDYKFKHLLVAQFNMRKNFTKFIDREIEFAKSGKKAGIILKMNSLEDKKMISKLYQASNAGVKIDLIVRGICCLVPGIKGLSENINAISIVDRFLEHSRIFVFNNGGDQIIFAGSADWMKRNLTNRIEVAFPIFDENLKNEIKKILSIQLKDNIKARILDRYDKNEYKKLKGNNQVQSQIATYEFLMNKNLQIQKSN